MKTVIEMAREAGFAVDAYPDAGLYGRLERFAALVRADGRARMVEQPAQQAFVGMVKDLFTITAWEKLDVVGSTKVYLNSPPAQRTWVELTEWQPIEMTDEDMYHYTNWISKR